MKKIITIFALLLSVSLLFGGCTHNGNSVTPTVTQSQNTTNETSEREEKDSEFSSTVTAEPEKMDFGIEKEDFSTASAATQSNAENSSVESSVSSLDGFNSESITPSPTLPSNITEGGSYTLSGNQPNGMITIDAGEQDVHLILQGLTVHNPNGPALFVKSAAKVKITLADGTVNNFSDGKEYTIDEESRGNGSIFSRSDLTINGKGTLTVTGNRKHGIVSKDNLIVTDGQIQITAANVGLEGKDCVKIGGGKLNIKAGTDGIRSDNTSDPTKGFISITGGDISISAGNDGIQAQTVLSIQQGNLAITAGGGNQNINTSDGSYKGIKAGAQVLLHGGSLDINAADDAIRSVGTIEIFGGKYTLLTKDDGIQADLDLFITGGEFIIECDNQTKSNGLHYENNGKLTNCSLLLIGAKQSTKIFSNTANGYFAIDVGNQKSKTMVTLSDTDEKVLMSYTPKSSFSYVVACHSKMTKGSPYLLTVGKITQNMVAQ